MTTCSAIDVTDGYRDGRGFLQARPLGIPTRARAGPELALGEIYRYLAELPWVPHAMTGNSGCSGQPRANGK